MADHASPPIADCACRFAGAGGWLLRWQTRVRLPFELMRVYSPSAEVQGHGPGQEALQTGKREVDHRRHRAGGRLRHPADFQRWPRKRPLHLELPVPTWASNKTQLWAAYLARLEAAGVDRDTPMPEKQVAAGHRRRLWLGSAAAPASGWLRQRLLWLQQLSQPPRVAQARTHLLRRFDATCRYPRVFNLGRRDAIFTVAG